MESSPSKNNSAAAAPSDLRETVKTLVIAIVLALIFRTFAFEPFHIPSDSMKNSLLVGDYIFVSKYSYGYGRYSFPFFGLPAFNGRIMNTTPERGDIVVFRPPGAIHTDYIKRLIGLPGDRIQMKEGVLYINDKAVPKEYIGEWTDNEPNQRVGPVVYKQYKETLPEGKSFQILNEQTPSMVENTEVYTVPPKHYFMMGDNRDDSRDSRFAHPVGFVPEENLIGRADFMLFSWSTGFSLRSDRFFRKLH